MKITTLFLLITFSFSCYNLKKENQSLSGQIENVQTKTNRDSLISYATQYVGTPYVYAGNGPKGFDCSGFVSYVFQHFNISLPRSSSGYKNLGVALEPEDFKIGDILVFYGYKDKTAIGHLGIICEANGMQSKFIHSSSGKANGVTITSLDTQHYTNRFYKCIDVMSK